MYIDIVPNRNSRPAILLREGWREGKRVRKRTIANLTNWPKEKVEALRRLLKGEKMVGATEAFVIESCVPHGHVQAVLGTIKKIGLDRIISSRRSRERDLVVGMIAERLIYPCSKLATSRLWNTSTLAEELGIGDASEDELYEAMDWLLDRKERIEKKLASMHLSERALVLYDVSSSYYEGSKCELAYFGHNRDGKKGRPIIVYGMLTDGGGRPVAVEVYPGNTGDPTTVPDQIDKLRNRFGFQRVVLVGDRGMLTQTQIDKLKEYPGIGWISALRSGAIRNLIDGGVLQMSLFDERNLAEISSPEFPDERLVACYNPILAAQRRDKREKLLAATERELGKIAREVGRRKKKILGKAEIGQKVGRVINRFKVAKHFKVVIGEGTFSFERNEATIGRESELDGIYVIRTSEHSGKMSASEAVRSYKRLEHVEQAFRSIKGLDILIRPIFHRIDRRVRAHIFLCMLAYYVEWHMRKALAPLLFEEENLEEQRKATDPVLPAQPSINVKKKKRARLTSEGLRIHSLRTLLAELSTLCRNRCRFRHEPSGSVFYQLTEPTPLQKKAFQLLGLFPVR